MKRLCLSFLFALCCTQGFSAFAQTGEVKLSPSAAGDYDYFGESVAVSGETVLVGNWLNDNARGIDAGAARFFQRAGTSWEEAQVVTAPDGEPGDQFGVSVAILGDVAVIGARLDDTEVDGASLALTGSAYVFVLEGETWTFRAKLVSPATERSLGDEFGASVALDPDRIIVGAPGAGNRRGAAYVFVRSGSGWVFQDKLEAPQPGEGDGFARSVAISGTYAVVGADMADGPAGPDVGAAYVFSTENNTVWTFQDELEPSDAAEGDRFGAAVSLAGDYAAVGSPRYDALAGQDAGAAYVFFRDSTAWTEQVRLTPSNAASSDEFGFSVALSATPSGHDMMVGARWHAKPTGARAGAAYLYRRGGTTWSQQGTFDASDGAVGDQFGNAVAVSGGLAVVGARWADLALGTDAGAAYVFPISQTSLPVLTTNLDRVDFENVPVGAAGEQILTVINVGQADLQLAGFEINSDADIGAFSITSGGEAGRLGSQETRRVSLRFIPQRAGLHEATLSIQSDAPDSPAQIPLLGFGQEGGAAGVTKILPGAGAIVPDFGGAVAVDGDYAVVGAPGEDAEEPGVAYIYMRTGGAWVQQGRLIPSGTAPGNRFGSAVALSGDFAVVGAWRENADQGAVYVFMRGATAWAEVARLTAADGAPGDQFGRSVAIDSTYLAVGAPEDDNINGSGAGAAYVFQRNQSNWQQLSKLFPSTGSQGNRFGWSVALRGDDLIVGSVNEGAFGEGAAYVFRRNGPVWEDQARLTASDGGLSDGFGGAVSIDGDYAAVGVPRHDPGAITDAGAVYVFFRTGTTWAEQAKLTPLDRASGMQFGQSVALNGVDLVVGAPGADSERGAAYAFSRAGTTWNQQAKLIALGGVAGDRYGASVDIFGNDLIAGAPDNSNVNGPSAGAAYMLARSGAIWTPAVTLLAQSLQPPQFGAAVAIDGDYALIAAPGDAETEGVVYVFIRSESAWVQQAEIRGINVEAGDAFGAALAIDGTYVVVGAPGDDTEGGVDAGSAFVFVRDGSFWNQADKIVATDGVGGDGFGAAVAINQDYIVVGASADDAASGEQDAGSAYVFARNGADWSQVQQLNADVPGTAFRFGSAVAINGTDLAVGSLSEGPAAEGAVYMYALQGGSWAFQEKLVASDPQSDAELGASLALSDTYLIAGAPNDLSGGLGSAYVFQRTGGTWGPNQAGKLFPEEGTGFHFGTSVDISGNALVVGAPGANSEQGSMFVYELEGGVWVEQDEISDLVGSPGDEFGGAVAVDGVQAIAGAAQQASGGASGNGAAYLISLGSLIVDVEESGEQPERYALAQNYPNPFNPSTTIAFTLARPHHVTLTVYDLLGRRVALLVDQPMTAGQHEVLFEAGHLPSGVYFYHLEAGSYTASRKLVLLK